MNVNDFKAEQIQGDKLIAIFVKQHELAVKYLPIEKQNGLLQTEDLPVNLHDGKGQHRLKDFAWRATEELCEAFDAASEKGWQAIHTREEIADAFHFLVEMALLGDVGPADIGESLPWGTDGLDDTLDALFDFRMAEHRRPVDGIRPMFSRPDINTSFVKLMTQLGMTCHTLKNKPWKTSQMLTDEPTFKARMVEVFHHFAGLCLSVDMTSQELADLYFRKSQVNEFRQRSNY